MAPEHRIGRYRRWYGRLLRLYPRTFRDRFAEPMAQTFTDLAHERTDANRGLVGFAATTFAETSAGIIRENLAQMTTQPLKYLRWILVTAVVLAIRSRVIPDLIEGYWSSPAGWAAVGYTTFPGLCGSLARYTRSDA